MKKLFTDKMLLIYRIIGVILIFIFLVLDFILVLNTAGTDHLNSYGERLSHYYAYFTTQSNYLVFGYFVFYLFHKKFKNTKPDFIIRLMVTVYITMTMLVFWLGLFTQGNIVRGMSAYEWISTVILHTVIPVAMILSFCMTAGDAFYKFSNHHKGNYWIICLYPFLYLICVLVRGYIRHLDHKPENTLFPYFFLDFYATNGVVMLATGSVLVLVLCTSFQYFFIWVNNLFYFKKQIKEHHPEKVKEIKTIIDIKKYQKLDYKGKIALILAIVVACFNIIFSVLYYTLRDVWSKVLNYPYNNSIVLAFSIIIIVFSTITIVFSIFGFANFYWARIIVGFLSVALICFNWIWILGPIFDIAIAFICFNNPKYSQADLDLYQTKKKTKVDFEKIKFDD